MCPKLFAWLRLIGLPVDRARTSQARSGDVNTVLKCELADHVIYVKSGPSLQEEYDRFLWLAGRIPAPRVLGWRVTEHGHDLVTSAVIGQDLATIAQHEDPNYIADDLAHALIQIHRTDISDCPFVNGRNGDVLVHGDACLPNFIFCDGEFRGIVDVGDFGIGRKETDLAAAIWSLQYNLGPGYGQRFLSSYGISDASEDQVEALRRAYIA
jgi:aminoglycoside phosphotransferase